jgi:hypothetical protein
MCCVGAPPVPLKACVKLELDALLVNVRVALAVPVAFGANFTE